VVFAVFAWRSWLVGALLAIVLAGGAAWAPQRDPLPMMDFVEYWAAGRLNAAGDNPYDPELIEEMEHQAGREGNGLPMLNPPWTLALVMPLGLLPPHPAHWLWLALQVAVLAGASQALWGYYGGRPEGQRLAWVLAFLFVPTLLALLFGQISPLSLAGATLFLCCLRRGQDGRAGAATVLLALKPHLVCLFWLALVPWAIFGRRWRLLAGAVLAGAAATGIALACNPAVLGQYVERMAHRPPEEFRTPTLGGLVREICKGDNFWVQYLAVVPGVLWLIVWGLRHRRDWDWGRQLPLLLLVSLLTAPYGAWPFDLVLLLVPLLQVAARASRMPEATGRTGLAWYAAINGTAMVLLARLVHFFWFFWMTPTLLVAYLVLQRPGQTPDRRHCSLGQKEEDKKKIQVLA
jgi:hypothetical protein